MLLNLGRQLLFYIPFLYLFNHIWGLTGLLYAQTGADICVTILAVLIGLPLLRKLGKMQGPRSASVEEPHISEEYAVSRIPTKS